jgi:hypothetical protein
VTCEPMSLQRRKIDNANNTDSVGLYGLYAVPTFIPGGAKKSIRV